MAMRPDCGAGGTRVPTIPRYRLLPRRPRWRQFTVTYAFSPHHFINSLHQAAVKKVFRRSFSRWSAPIPLRFEKIADYPSANIKIGWYTGNEFGHGLSFDGPGRKLAYAEEGWGLLHMDADETWVLNFRREKSKMAIDLESVVMHEIGHLLGLDHTSMTKSIMYPYLTPRRKKVHLTVQDVMGVQFIYGANPDFDVCSLVHS